MGEIPSIFDIGTGIYNIFSNERDRKDSLRQQDFENQFAINQAGYQRHLNDLVMQREDNAMQRRVKDLEAAGLSPVLAIPGAAASSPLAAMSAKPSPRGHANHSQALNTSLMMSTVLGQQNAQVGLTRAEADRVRTETELARRRYHDIELPEALRQKDRHPYNLQNLYWQAKQTEASRDQLWAKYHTELWEGWLKYLESEYISKHSMRIPTTTQEYLDFKSSLSKAFGHDSPGMYRPALDLLKLLTRLYYGKSF